MKNGKGKRFNLWGCFGWFFVFWIVMFIVAYLAFGWWAGNELKNAEQRWTDAGLATSFGDLVAQPVPDGENFAAQVPLKGLGISGAVPPELGDLWEPLSCENRLSLRGLELITGTRPDLAAWVQSLRECGRGPAIPEGSPEMVLVAMTDHIGAIVQQLAPGIGRAHSLVVPGMEQHVDTPVRGIINVSYLNVLSELLNSLALRTSALLATGEVEEATMSMEVAWTLIEAVKSSPSLFDCLVVVNSTQSMCGRVWAGIDSGSFNDDQLRRLGVAMGRIAIREHVVTMFQAEARNLVDLFEHMNGANQRDVLESLGTEGIWAPAPFWEANSARVLDWMRQYVVLPLRDEGWRAAAAGSARLTEEIKQSRSRFDITAMMASLSMPAYGKIVESTALAEAFATQAQAACALERYFIGRGRYPESLGALVLDYLSAVPADPMAPDAALGFALDGERYRLWSVGFDGVDDGGVIVGERGDGLARSLGKSSYLGDWVWGYPPPVVGGGGADEKRRSRAVLPR